MILFIIVLLIIDVYVLNGLRNLPQKWLFLHKKWFIVAYLVFSVLLIAGLITVTFVKVGFSLRLCYLVFFFLELVFKASFALFILLDDLRRFGVYIVKRFKKPASTGEVVAPALSAIPRSEFLLKAGLLAGTVPLAALKLNMKSGLYDYHVKRHKLYLPNLPKVFDGIKLAQISDIHSGSFYNKKAVLGGVEMLLREKADLVFFTGDLVNAFSNELRDYQDIFGKVKAPLGVFSTLGTMIMAIIPHGPARRIKNGILIT